MSKVMIIGAGGVGGVVTHKCAHCPKYSRISSWPAAPRRNARPSPPSWTAPFATAQVDADNVDGTDRPAATRAARAGDQRGPALPGPHHHGRLPGRRRALPRHRQLRAPRYGQVRIQVAVGLPGPVRAGRPDGAPGLRFRPRRHQRVHRLPRQTPLRRDPRTRHHRRQRRRSRLPLRHQFQPGNQHPRGHRRVPSLGRRRIRRHARRCPKWLVSTARKTWGLSISTACTTRNWSR